VIVLEVADGGVVIPVRVRAAARRTGLAGVHDGALRIDVTAAPEKGKANRAVVELLSEVLGVAKRDVQLVSGATSSSKRVLVAGLGLEAVRGRLSEALGQE
jgi:uncharacterized protein (TIGR00251 family)